MIATSSMLLVGLFIGMRHALEADHVAAVASLVSRKQSLAHTLRQGTAWGLGHTITLLLFGSIVIFMDSVMPATLAKGLEAAVGVMLLLLGGDVLRRLARDKVHFHAHRHAPGYTHFHAHSHVGESITEHSALSHDHEHPGGFPLRALLVGLMHGMAGSAAVILLALEAVQEPFEGVIYILVFGLGSMLGMALLSVAISLPMHLSARRLTGAHNGMQLVIGVATIGMGVTVLLENRGVFSG
jgi:cytochrome c biogenesis protein CcdA